MQNTHTLKIYKASLKTLKQVTNENIAQYSELRFFYQLVHQFNASILSYFINIWKVQINLLCHDDSSSHAGAVAQPVADLS